MGFMMNRPCRAFMAFAAFFFLLLDRPAFSEAFTFAKAPGAEEGPLVITSDTLEIDNEKKSVTFTGNVTAKKDDWVIHCIKMILLYSEAAAGSAAESEKMQVEKIVATGDVRVLRSGGGEAAAQEAVYYQADEKIILTGKPVVRQGEDFVEGSKITLFLQDNRSIVEGSEKEKVRAVIAPRAEGR